MSSTNADRHCRHLASPPGSPQGSPHPSPSLRTICCGSHLATPYPSQWSISKSSPLWHSWQGWRKDHWDGGRGTPATCGQRNSSWSRRIRQLRPRTEQNTLWPRIGSALPWGPRKPVREGPSSWADPLCARTCMAWRSGCKSSPARAFWLRGAGACLYDGEPLHLSRQGRRFSPSPGDTGGLTTAQGAKAALPVCQGWSLA